MSTHLPSLVGVSVPDHLADDPVARGEWDRLVELLATSNRLTATELPLLAAYCALWSMHVKAVEEVAINGITTELHNADGDVKGVKESPAAGLLVKTSDRIRSLAAELGLTPRSRFSQGRRLRGKDKEDARTQLADRLERLGTAS